MEELELESYGRIIKIIIHDATWCEVHLLVNGKDITLGENCLDKIISKLLISFIHERDRSYFTYQDMELFSVFNLMGPHAVVAGKEIDDYGIELIFLSNEGKVIPLVYLSKEDMKKWITKLIKFFTSYMHHN